MPITTNSENTPQIYVPTLHRELVQHPVPKNVLFMDPGLRKTSALPGFFHPQTYPFTAEQADKVLAELLTMGEALNLDTPTGSQSARERVGGNGIPNGEKADLARFASGGKNAPAPSEDTGIVAAQKVLILAWDLEERLVEINRLRHEVAVAAKPLAENLRDHSLDGEPEPLAQDFLNFFTGTAPLSEDGGTDWRLALAAMAAFFPKNAVLVTSHAGMRADLLEAGMLLPLPEDVAEKLTEWPEPAKAALLWVHVPLWRILGRARQPENTPWLLVAPEIIVSR